METASSPARESNAAERALDGYLSSLAKLAERNTQTALPVLEQLVRDLNEVNRRHGMFIETLEREELCDFANDALKAVGIRFETDVTEQWREW
jgi:hypothetical protein